MVFFSQNIGQCPVTEAMDIPEFPFTIEDLLRPFAGEAKGAREFAQELDDLGDVVVIFPILGAGLRVEEVVPRD